jgi:transposase
MLQFTDRGPCLQGNKGTLPVIRDDTITVRLAMLFEGQCEGLGPARAARKFGLTKQRYYQLLAAFRRKGAEALLRQKRGPKTHYRRTDEAIRQVIRHRFLDPEASAEVIAQKLRQCGFWISIRSVHRIMADFGLQKKPVSGAPESGRRPPVRRDPSHQGRTTSRAVRGRRR